MNIIYRYWEPNQGLEEIQAKIYKDNNPDERFELVTAQLILARYEREKIDPRTVRYALTEDGRPLAYIQARDYVQIEETHLGYPWALKGCPREVQNKLFDEMLEYITQREEAEEYAIRMIAPMNREENVKFFKNKGLIVKSIGFRFKFDVNRISEMEYTDSEYSYRLATTEDINLLVELIKADGRYIAEFETDEEIVRYFKDLVFKVGHVILVFKDDQLVMASAPLIFKSLVDGKENLILRFFVFLPGHEKAFKSLIIGISKECMKANYGMDKSLITRENSYKDRDSRLLEVIEEFKPEKEVSELVFGLEK
jgi:hypothetical protein